MVRIKFWYYEYYASVLAKNLVSAIWENQVFFLCSPSYVFLSLCLFVQEIYPIRMEMGKQFWYLFWEDYGLNARAGWALL